MTEDLTDTIKQSAEGPASASVDGTSVSQHSLAELVVADKHVGAKAAGKNPAKALVLMKIVSPGAV
jgi:hypothetical protein